MLLKIRKSPRIASSYTGTIHRPKWSTELVTLLPVAVPFHLWTELNAPYEP